MDYTFTTKDKFMFEKYFGKEEVNIGRQEEFDIARAFSIIGMIFTHCYEMSGVGFSTGFGYIITTVLGSFLGAPLFMFYMGAAVRYSRNATFEGLAKRGIIIFILAYALNIFRRILPDMVVSAHDGVVLETNYYLTLLISCDILQFAGLALIALGIIIEFKIPDKAVLLTGAVLSVIGTFTCGIDFGSKGFNSLFGLFLGTKIQGSSGGFFSFFHYFIFVAAGYVFGKYWKRCKDKKGFFVRFSPVCGIIGIICFVIEIRTGNGVAAAGNNLVAYYYLSFWDAIICFLNAIAFSGLYYWVFRVFPKWVTRASRVMSSNIGIVYFVHLILARWIIYVLLMTYLEVEITVNIVIMVALFLIVLSYIVARLYTGKKI